MAVSAFSIIVDQDDANGKIRIIIGTFTMPAGDYVAGGFDFASKLIAAVSGQTAASILAVNFMGNGGLVYEYIRSTGKLQIRDAAHTILAAAALPAGAVADVIRFVAFCNKFQ